MVQPTIYDLVQEGTVTEFGWDYIISLSRVVQGKCYRMERDPEDLRQTAIMDCASYLMEFDPEGFVIRNMRTFLFTRMRNAMSNYKYHNSKSPLLDSKVIEDCNPGYSFPEFDYSFSTLEEARELSLRLWRMVR